MPHLQQGTRKVIRIDVQVWCAHIYRHSPIFSQSLDSEITNYEISSYGSLNFIRDHCCSIWDIISTKLGGNIINGWVQLCYLLSKYLPGLLHLQSNQWPRKGWKWREKNKILHSHNFDNHFTFWRITDISVCGMVWGVCMWRFAPFSCIIFFFSSLAPMLESLVH